MNACEIGCFLSELRKQKGLKQKDVAEAIQVSDKAISRWETGKGIPDVSSLQSLSDFYEVSINEILAGRYIKEEEIKEMADQNLKAMAKKETGLKKKLFVAISGIIGLIALFGFALLILMPKQYFIGSGISLSYDVTDGDLDKVFRHVANLEEAGTEYSIMLDTYENNKYIVITTQADREDIYMYSRNPDKHLEDLKKYSENMSKFFDEFGQALLYGK